MKISLDNVRSILGVPVEGSCFNAEEGGKTIKPKTAIALATTSLGVTEEVVSKEYKAFAIRL